MAVATLAPPVVLDGPPPVAPEHGLLTIPGVLQESADGHWMNGARIYGYPSDVPLSWEPCLGEGVGTNRVKDVGGEIPSALFGPFAIYLPIQCTARGIGADWEEWTRRAEVTLNATQSFAIEKALAQGVASSANPFLGDSSVTVLNSGTAVKPEVGLAFLEDAIGATGREGIIHMTPGVVAELGFNYLKECDPDGVDESGDEYIESAVGTPISAGGGYIGASANGGAAGSGNAWAFASGPIRVYLSSMQMLDISSTLNRDDNTFDYRAEKFALVIFDTALQAAVKVDYTP